jgi:hypothetical protein
VDNNLHDGDLTNSMNHGYECDFGMTFLKDHVGILDEAKIFISRIAVKDSFVNTIHL